jgi:hypothetical protein
MLSFWLGMSLCLTLGGCATKVWYRPNSTAQEAREDQKDCQEMYQIVMQGARAVNVDGTSLDKKVNHIVNEKEFVEDCMALKGYKHIPLWDVPTNQVGTVIR